MICSKTKLGSELDKIKKLLIENGYPADVLRSCINKKLANFAAEKTFGPEKCPVYLKLPWIGNVSSKFENQINKAITSCFYAVKHRVIYSTRVMLPSAKKDSVPTTQKSCVVYKFSCRCEARYVGRTTQRLADRIKQHVPTSIRKKVTPYENSHLVFAIPKSIVSRHHRTTPTYESRMRQNIYRR